MLRTSLVLLVALVSCGCVAPDNESASLASSLQTSFHIKNPSGEESTRFAVGEEITLELDVTNVEDHSVTYQATGPGFDFSIWQGNVSIWSNFHDVQFTQVITERQIAAHQTIALSGKWRGIDNAGTPVSPGEYVVTPELVFFVDGTKIAVPSPKSLVLESPTPATTSLASDDCAATFVSATGHPSQLSRTRSLISIFFLSAQEQNEKSRIDKLQAGIELPLTLFPKPPTLLKPPKSV